MKRFLLFLSLSLALNATAEDGFVSLFNGKSLDGWIQRGGTANYRIEGDAIVGTSITGTPNSFLCTDRNYSDFILEYEFKVDPRLNSGVQIRSEVFDTATQFSWQGETIEIAAGRVHGYQVEIDPDTNRKRLWSAGIFDEGRRKWMYPGFAGGDAAAFSRQGAEVFKPNAWNHVRIEARGTSIRTWLNGQPRAHIEDDVTARGFIALQVHSIHDESINGTEVRWRNLRIREIATAETTAAATPMNILVLYADDWRHDTLGAAGNPIVQTPNLDRLAKQGVRFTHSYVTTAICGVSRASLYTGQWMARHGNRGFNEFETPWEESYPGLLRDHGYHVGHVGKWHNGDFPADRFDFGRSYFRTHWIEEPDGSKIHVTQKNENDALDFLRTRPSGQPFYLTVSFFATHAEDHNPLQFLPQPESMSLYEDVTIPVPANATNESFHRLPPFIANEANEGRNRWHWRFDTPEKYQTMMKNYYRLATEVDATSQRVLDELDRQGVLANTLVIFTTDNGYYHAEHGLADKWYPHQESIRVPLIVMDPRMDSSRRNQLNHDITLNVDLAPTILEAAGIPAPATMQGRNLSPLYLNETPADWRTEFFYEHPTLRSIDFIPASEALVRQDWKYLYWPEHDLEQLFDLTNDQQEENDLASDPQQADRLAAMRQQFNYLKAEAL